MAPRGCARAPVGSPDVLRGFIWGTRCSKFLRSSATRNTTPSQRAAALGQKHPQVSRCGCEPFEVCICQFTLVLEHGEYLIEALVRMVHLYRLAVGKLAC